MRKRISLLQLGALMVLLQACAADVVEENPIPIERSVDVIRQVAHPLTSWRGDYDPLLQLIGDAEVVLLGEPTHGTDEFYRARAFITQRTEY